MGAGKQVDLKWRILSLLIGAIGALGEAYWLWHILVECLPYKETAEAGLFEVIAVKSFFAAPAIGVAMAWLFTRSSLKWGPLVAAVLCPAVFVLFYVLAFSWAGLGWDETVWNEGLTQADLLVAFASDAAGLAVAGAAIGFLSGWIVENLRSRSGQDGSVGCH